MEDQNLFQSEDGEWLTTRKLVAALEAVGADRAKVLYIHSGIRFGSPNPELSREELLGSLYAALAELGNAAICLPAFTFSFCNGEDYDREASRSRMGALNEYIRRLPGTKRSIDPLLSTIVRGGDRGLAEHLTEKLGTHSIGADSTFDRLHGLGEGVKFLFLGAQLSECFTYTHFVEERVDSPYRYRREFRGRIHSGGRSWEDTYTLFVRYAGVVTATDGLLEQTLRQNGDLREAACGEASLACLDEAAAYNTIAAQLATDSHCYIASDPGDRNRFFEAKRMVAL